MGRWMTHPRLSYDSHIMFFRVQRVADVISHCKMCTICFPQRLKPQMMLSGIKVEKCPLGWLPKIKYGCNSIMIFSSTAVIRLQMYSDGTSLYSSEKCFWIFFFSSCIYKRLIIPSQQMTSNYAINLPRSCGDSEVVLMQKHCRHFKTVCVCVCLRHWFCTPNHQLLNTFVFN